ncbi:hypothetical protein PpBr36_04914 [Pyricularia pennisetigena]|uniref:hypothetical protein n=1 Tax=Pyricularia pennisetigena TaxID=1578925 RepID=UPI00114DBC5D|nr:hypothetical protein PpBr36_04914 [Pyricularia pennisetigena]TLS26368.1 hypothetical protein PpBr36_04914 [Pyricularia pennisetigena]
MLMAKGKEFVLIEFSASDATKAARRYIQSTGLARDCAAASRANGGAKITTESLLSFCRRQKYPYNAVRLQYRRLRNTGRPIESNQASDEDPKVLTEKEDAALIFGTTYKKAKALAAEQEITASTCWSADKIGTKEGQIWVLTTRGPDDPPPPVYRSKHSFTMMAGGNAADDPLPQFCLLKNWSDTEPGADEYYSALCDGETVFWNKHQSFADDGSMYVWIRHFNMCTGPMAAEVQRLGSPSLWRNGLAILQKTPFTHMIDRLDPNQLSSRTARAEKRPRIWRWLVLGGATGRISIDIIDYCLRFDIQILTLPAHSKQLMHPIRQGPCRFLKPRDLNKLLQVFRHDTEDRFVSAFRDEMESGFSEGHLIMGFEDSGIWPLIKKKMLDHLPRPADP